MNKQSLIKNTLLIYVLSSMHLNAENIQLNFNENKIDVGTLYIYKRSTGTEKSIKNDYYCYYIVSIDSLEVLKLSKNGEKFSRLRTLKFNWNYLTLEKYQWFFIGDTVNIVNKINNKTFEFNSVVNFIKKEKSFKWKTKRDGQIENHTGKVKLTGFPLFSLSHHDHDDLCYVLRHFPLEKSEIDAVESHNGMNVDIKIEYIGKEKVQVPYGEILCHKFSLVPKSFIFRLMAKDILIWLTAEDDLMYMVQYKNDNSQSTYSNVEQRLVSINEMSLDDWESFKTDFQNHTIPENIKYLTGMSKN